MKQLLFAFMSPAIKRNITLQLQPTAHGLLGRFVILEQQKFALLRRTGEFDGKGLNENQVIDIFQRLIVQKQVI